MVQTNNSKQISRQIQKKEFNELLQKLNQDFGLYIPKKDKSTYSFEKYSGFSGNLSNYQTTRIPPKKFLFPQNEVLFSFIKNSDQIEILKKEEDLSKQIILGIRNCDARSFVILDTFFSSGKYKDLPYLNKRNRTLFIGLACNSPASTCFCTALGGDPYSSDGLDALLIDIGDSYIITVTSKSGEIFYEYIKDYSEVSENAFQIQKELASNSRNMIEHSLDLSNIQQDLDLLFENDLWAEVSQSCLGCGSCSFICPTCHCFDIQDEITKTGGKRVRIWDHCQNSIFTVETSGHNPRKSGRERTRQRIYHKFNYYPKNYHLLGCVGCGRCIRACPAGQDIRKTLQSIKKLLN